MSSQRVWEEGSLGPVRVPGTICTGGGMLPGPELCVCCKSGLQRVEGAEVVKDTAFHTAIALHISTRCRTQHLKTTNTTCLTQVLRARNLRGEGAQLGKYGFLFFFPGKQFYY